MEITEAALVGRCGGGRYGSQVGGGRKRGRGFRLTDGLPVRVADVDVEGPVRGVDQHEPAAAVVLVALLHRARVPVGPVDAVLEHGQSERVGQDAVVHRVPVMAVQIRVPAEGRQGHS